MSQKTPVLTYLPPGKVDGISQFYVIPEKNHGMKTTDTQLLLKISSTLTKGNLALAGPYFAGNIKWNILGETPVIAKVRVLEALKMPQLQSFPVITIKNIIAGENAVVIERTGKAITKSGQPCNQAY